MPGTHLKKKKKTLALWPALQCYTDALLLLYPQHPLPGSHRFSFANGRIVLTLVFDDVLRALPNINGEVDAWFLDGFAPAKNPEMWSPSLFAAMASHSHLKTTFATFTAASVVREGLKQAGFIVERVKGFGNKRHMLCGSYSGEHTGSRSSHLRQQKIWLSRDINAFSRRKAIVIGAGLAGCSTAYALAQRGWHITVVDKATQPAKGASGNLQGALYMRLSGAETVLSTLLIQGYTHTLRLLAHLLKNSKGTDWNVTGLVQSGFDENERARQQKIIARALPANFVSSASASELSAASGILLERSGLWFEQGGWVHPPALCHALLDSPFITFQGESDVSAISHQNNVWKVTCKSGNTLQAPVVIIANSYAATMLAQTAHLPLKSIRGQLSYVPATPDSKKLTSVLCGEHYIAPAIDGMHTIGATHQFNDDDFTVRIDDHRQNLLHLKQGFPAMYAALGGDRLQPETLRGRTGFRCSTPDYLPAIGPIADAALFKQQFAQLSRDAKYPFRKRPVYLPGLYVNVGHGSRGLITCPLSGEIIAGHIENEVLPVTNSGMEALHPSRFLARKLIKGQFM